MSSVAAAFIAHYALASYSSRTLGGMGGYEVVVSRDGLRAEANSVWASGRFTVNVDDVPLGSIADSTEYTVALFACAAIGLDVTPGPVLDGVSASPPPLLGAVTRRTSVRHDWDAPYSYIGTADLGTAESEAAWVIRRIAVDDEGDTVTTTAVDTAWTNRAAGVYV